ncbi:MAG: rhodanese-like domain-containing protein [Bacteroides sp.]|jgi:rhodanese-related sulfurtransferase|nr:rhodanese-like domain-containing protein [Bacteroides sp.]
MAHLAYIKKAGLILFLASAMVACSGSSTQEGQTGSSEETALLLQYLEENGDVVNHPSIPFFIDAQEIYEKLKGSNYLVIDVRSASDFNRGHIENAVNVLPEDILDYFENQIEPASFEKIAIVCNNAHLSGYVTAILRMLGYDNTYNLRFGMSAWNENIARRHWLANISDDMIGNLETAPHPKNEPGELPSLNTNKTNGYEILRERAQKALEVNWEDVIVDYMDILMQTEDYYVINYWPKALYDQGHLPGAIQYDPKKAFHREADILTLPTDRPLVVYCFTGQNASYANAFLSVMGYDFRSLEYGANGFIHQTMNLTQPAGRSFSEIHIKNFPLATDVLKQISSEMATPVQQIETTVVQGGC